MTRKRWPGVALILGAVALSAGCASGSSALAEQAAAIAIADGAAESEAAAGRGSRAPVVPRGQPMGVDYSSELEAATPPEREESDAPDWRHTLSLYAWVPNLHGDMRVEGIDSSPDLTRGDVISNTDLAISGRYEVQPPGAPFSFWVDLFYANISADDSAETPVGRIDADVDVRQTFLEFAAAFHAWQSEEEITTMAGPTARAKFDLYGGGRYTRFRTKFDLKIKSVGAKASYDEAEDWLDAIVGARIRYGVTPRLWFVARGDIGGFDLATSSHRTWTLTGTLQYLVTAQWAVGAGWRTMDIDYKRGDYKVDARMSGPFATVTYDF